MSQNPEKSGKKSYLEPTLKVYGTIETVTLAQTMSHVVGDNGNGNNKT